MSEEEKEVIDEEEEIIDDEEDQTFIDKISAIKSRNELKVIRILGKERQTTNFISYYEYISIVCSRAKEILNGSPIFVEKPGIIRNAETNIAIREILEKKCPLSIRRERNRNEKEIYLEIWPVNELELTQKCIEDLNNFLKIDNSIKDYEQILESL